MNVLQINTVCGIGSIGRIATDLHSLLVSLGHQSTIAFGRSAPMNCARTIRIGNRIDNYLHVARTRLFDNHGFGSAAATRAFISQMRQLNPDVIYLHNLHGYYLQLGLLFEYLKQAAKPVIWTLFDCWAFTGHCVYFDRIGCDLWKSECHDCPQRAEYPKSLFLDRSRWNYRQKKALFTGIRNLTIVTSSKWLAELVKESFLQDYPLTVINTGIDLTVFKPTQSDFRERYKLQGHFILLGVASSWVERKGLSYFINLAKQLGPDEKIVLVGVSKEVINRLPMGIMGIATTNSTKELASIYSAADVFVNPTLEDNFPTTNLEAMACGTPVVTFKSGGSPECLDGGCGVAVERGDLLKLVDAIGVVRQLGKDFYASKCRTRAEDRFDKDARLAEYIALSKGL
jgi:putative colanic acid biosynthesis glycosyltransferase